MLVQNSPRLHIGRHEHKIRQIRLRIQRRESPQPPLRTTARLDIDRHLRHNRLGTLRPLQRRRLRRHDQLLLLLLRRLMVALLAHHDAFVVCFAPIGV